MKLTRVGKGGVTLPLRKEQGGAFFPCRVRRDGTVAPAVPCILLERESIEVPAWYVAELHLEPGFAARFKSGEMTVSHVEPIAVTVAEEAPLPAPLPAPAAPSKGKSKKKG